MSKKPAAKSSPVDRPAPQAAAAKAPAAPAVKPWEHAKSTEHGHGSAGDPLAARFVESLSYDTRLYAADIRGSLAHARMLARAGLITSSDFQAIERGLAQITREIESAPAGPTAVGVPGAWPGWRIELEDVHMCIEAALTEKIGDPGRKLHTGRSRNDQVALDLRLWLREACGTLGAALGELCEAFVSLAAAQGGVVLPSYTHVQRAQPIVVGAECMAWWAMFDRDRRLVEAMPGWRGGLDSSPLGSGAVAGSTLGLDREMTARELGFAGPSLSSIDATASRDEALDFLYALSRTAMHLSRLAEQWILYCSTEFGFLTLGEAYTTGSSMMPQKRNPDMLELIRGRCGNVYGHYAALATSLKGLPLAYNRDLQEDKRQVFAAYDLALDCIVMAARIVASARFNERRIAEGLERGFLDATVLAEYMVSRGVPFRTAHQVVGRLVRVCDRSGRHALAQLHGDEIREALSALGHDGDAVGKDVFTHLGAANVTRRYRSAGHGGTGPGGYADWLDRLRGEPGGGAPRPGGSARSSPPAAAPAPARPTPTAPPAGLGPASPFSAEIPLSPRSSAAIESHEAEPPFEPTPPRGGRGPRPGATPAGPAAPVASLFAEEPLDASPQGLERWAPLIEAYGRAGRTLDDLPYTPEFEALAREAGPEYPGLDKYGLFRRLHNLRKAGKLPKTPATARPASLPVKLNPEEESWLRDEVAGLVGSLGQRDQLPYSPTFDGLVESFNARTGRGLEPHAVWRLVAKLAK